MTLNEALEYLNLPSNPGRQLVRKRYLELKNNYLKAIYNAPSDHFSTLYRENLQKIEESYSLLIGELEGFSDLDSGIQQNIMQIQQVVNSFLANRKFLDNVSREKLKNYIERIDILKDSLKRDHPEPDPQDSSAGSDQNQPSWYWETDKLKTRNQPIDDAPESTPVESKRPRIKAIKLIDRIVYTLPESDWGRKYLFDRLLLVAILTIVILVILGCFYVILPLLLTD